MNNYVNNFCISYFFSKPLLVFQEKGVKNINIEKTFTDFDDIRQRLQLFKGNRK